MPIFMVHPAEPANLNDTFQAGLPSYVRVFCYDERLETASRRQPMTSTRFTILTAVAVVLGTMASSAAAQTLDYEFFKTKVEPIFLKKRPGHARCVVCHSESTNAFRLQKPAEDGAWTEEQSRENFENVRNLVKPGDPTASHLLMHPLSPDAGGDKFHGGGRQFASENDPEWQILAEWVRGAKANASAAAAAH
jgi:hypothetical protein